MKNLIFVFTVFLATTAFAGEPGGSNVGLQAGQITLNGDVATWYTNSLGWGAFYQYVVTDTVTFELAYANSSHTGTANSAALKMTQHSLTGDLLYTFKSMYGVLPYLKGGVDFVIHAPQDVPGVGSNTQYNNLSTFGLNLGLGAEYMLTEQTGVGLDLTFHNIFDTAVSAPNAVNVKAIQGFSTVLARFVFKFGGEEKHRVDSDEKE